MLTDDKRPELSLENRQEMDRYGIIRVPADSFLYREFRYTNLQDALAEAKRDAEARSGASVSPPRRSSQGEEPRPQNPIA
jgi:hypothetical protein